MCQPMAPKVLAQASDRYSFLDMSSSPERGPFPYIHGQSPTSSYNDSSHSARSDDEFESTDHSDSMSDASAEPDWDTIFCARCEKCVATETPLRVMKRMPRDAESFWLCGECQDTLGQTPNPIVDNDPNAYHPGFSAEDERILAWAPSNH